MKNKEKLTHCSRLRRPKRQLNVIPDPVLDHGLRGGRGLGHDWENW